jgi:hypothetical protein
MVTARETVWLEECEGTTTFTVMLSVYLETEPPETPTTIFHSAYKVYVKLTDFENMAI